MLVNNTIYFYNITSCSVPPNQLICNSTSGSFRTNQTNISESIAPTPIPTIQGPAYDLKLEQVSAPASVPKGSSVPVNVLVKNNGLNKSFFNLIVTARPSSAASSTYQIHSASALQVEPGATFAESFSWSTLDVLEGNYEITASVTLIQATLPEYSTSDNTKSTTISITAPTNLPEITGIAVQALATSAVITWATDMPSDSVVSYGLETLSSRAEEAIITTQHKLTLTNLQPGKRYRYSVSSCAEEVKCTSSPESTFGTLYDSSGICSKDNKCINGNTSWITYKEQDGQCVQDKSTLCVATGCMVASCNPLQGGCFGIPSEDKCEDICQPDGLKVTPVCIEAASDPMKGECSYLTELCSEDRLCTTTIPCGNENYYCIKEGRNFAWNTSNEYCIRGPDSFEPVVPTLSSSVKPIKVESTSEKVDPATLRMVSEQLEGKALTFWGSNIASEPAVVLQGDDVTVLIETNSKTALIGTPACHIPTETVSKCYCNIAPETSSKHVKCYIENAVEGAYAITMGNQDGEVGGAEVIIEYGKRAKVARLILEAKEDKVQLYALIAASLAIILYFAGSIVYKRKHRKGLGRKLTRELELIEDQKKQLQGRLMKGAIATEEYTRAYSALDARKVTAEARLKEWRGSYGKEFSEQKEAPADSEALAKETEALEKAKILKLKGEIKTAPEPEKKEEAHDDEQLDLLLGELKKKKEGAAEKQS